MEADQAARWAPAMTGAERDRRMSAWLELYQERGWQSCGDVFEDRRRHAILGLMRRAAERAAREEPNPETLAQRDLWRERLATFEATAPS